MIVNTDRRKDGWSVVKLPFCFAISLIRKNGLSRFRYLKSLNLAARIFDPGVAALAYRVAGQCYGKLQQGSWLQL